LGHGKRHLPAIQIFIAVRLIPILTHLSSRWTVHLILYNHHLIKPKLKSTTAKKIVLS
jgi:hypothetical protein